MRKIKILHFIHSLSGGGAEKQLTLLCNEMDKSAHEAVIFCINDFQQEKIDSRVKIIKSHHYGISLRYILEIYQAIKTHNPDVIQIWLPPSISIPALIWGGLLRKKIIFSYRSKMQFFRGLSYVEFFLTLLFANKIISNRPVNDSLPSFRWLYKIKQGEVIYNAVSIPAQYLQTDHNRNNPVRFIFAGRLDQAKNGVQLVHALAKLDNTSSWILDIFGKGHQEKEMLSLIKKYGLSDKIFLRGHSHNIYAEMKNADALIFPSIFEGMPNALVEALCIGLPVIASDIQANRHVVGNTPCVIWIDPLNPDDMSKKIAEFIEGHCDVIALSTAGKVVASQYTLEKMVEGYQRSYAKLAQP